MTRDEALVKFAAEKVMGWHLWPKEPSNNRYYYEGQSTAYTICTWNPLDSWADAGMLLEKVNGAWGLAIAKAKLEWMATLFPYDERLSEVEVTAGSQTRAITEAICRAFGFEWEEEGNG